jgi:hypothetical protein
VTPASYVYSTSSGTSVSSAGQQTVYISITSFYVLAVETMFERTSSPCVTTATLSTTKGSVSGWVNT